VLVVIFSDGHGAQRLRWPQTHQRGSPPQRRPTRRADHPRRVVVGRNIGLQRRDDRGTDHRPCPCPCPGARARNARAGRHTRLVAAYENSDGSPLLDLRGYTVHYGTSSLNYTSAINLSNPGLTTYVVQALPAGKYYFAVAAYNSTGTESSLSSEVAAQVD